MLVRMRAAEVDRVGDEESGRMESPSTPTQPRCACLLFCRPALAWSCDFHLPLSLLSPAIAAVQVIPRTIDVHDIDDDGAPSRLVVES
jgi:hypothetical protein